jgi:AAT family amino acid transporter
VSIASDLTAAQLVLAFWTDANAWPISLCFLLFLLGINATDVGAYGELEYWLSVLKMATIIVFIILGVFVNVGLNRQHDFIGFRNWKIDGAPFVGGFGGFAKVFVTASFACLYGLCTMSNTADRLVDGGTESLGVTAGETRNPTKNMPRVVRFVFWRCEFCLFHTNHYQLFSCQNINILRIDNNRDWSEW